MPEATQERNLVLKAAAGVLPMSLLMHAKGKQHVCSPNPIWI